MVARTRARPKLTKNSLVQDQETKKIASSRHLETKISVSKTALAGSKENNKSDNEHDIYDKITTEISMRLKMRFFTTHVPTSGFAGAVNMLSASMTDRLRYDGGENPTA